MNISAHYQEESESLELKILSAYQEGLLFKNQAMKLINQAISCFNEEDYNKVLDEYVTIIRGVK